FGIAYRMLGDRAAAEDVVQEAFLKTRDAEAVASPRAWLSTVVTRLCIDQLKSARARRESYVGPWLPEPLPTDDKIDRDTISMAFLVVMETLSPIERAVFLLHEVFDYSYAEIADIVGKEEAAVRQILHRAKTHVVARRPRFSGTREQHHRLLMGFVQACTAGDLQGLEQLLVDDVVALSDGGGKVRAARKPVEGAVNVARLLIGLTKKGPANATYDIRPINGDPAIVIYDGARIDSVLSIATDGQKITEIEIVRNPDKLARLCPPDASREGGHPMDLPASPFLRQS
ncbi:MAG TPA: RNA polymerase sigma-70 factor, partial [Polyangiaceae bacterium]